MPGLLSAHVPETSPPTAAAGSSAIWSKKRDEITFDQLQKFWNELPLQARQQLLRVDKHGLFEQARKNLYCSRCNGLLLEGFTQIVMYGKSLQPEGAYYHLTNRAGTALKAHIDCESDDIQDPSVHPWGGLVATRDGILTLLDCFINARSLRALQNVFDSARAREHERELLYPDACGGSGRGWISQAMNNFGRGHGTRETCALHTARLSCDTLVDFWSALSEETRMSLLRMKEEDFIERLVYRFDSKRFCRDCRRNVIREFKELKELKRMRRELRCTSWFCVADTAFQYEVSEDTVQADWHQSFIDTVGTYHHFEWAIGTGEGKSDILEFEDVGMNGKVLVNGLDLGGLSACFITLRAWKLDGRCTELCVKAHALKGQPCVHRRLMIGDGFVTITKGESIRSFFEHAEEAEEEEDDDALDKDGNDIDSDGSRPQKHAKSPELAREFLLDAATVIFKEQVEKAFREGTARQNAHSIVVVFLCLKLLETERVMLLAKRIITLEKQIKLLEEEEREKREEEERRERRKAKEREKKLRRKERLKGKERQRERKQNESNPPHLASPASTNDSSTSTQDDSSPATLDSGDSVSDPGEVVTPHRPISPDVEDEQSPNGCIDTKNLKSDSLQHQCHIDEETGVQDSNSSFIIEQSKSSRRKMRLKKDSLSGPAPKWYDDSGHHDGSDTILTDSSRLNNGGHRPMRERVVKTNTRSCNPKFGEKYHSSSNRQRERYDSQSCSCNQNSDYRQKDGFQISTMRPVREIKTTYRTEAMLDMPRPMYRGSKYGHGCFTPDSCAPPRGKLSSSSPSRDIIHTRQVWEPMDSRRKGTRSNPGSDVTSRAAVVANQCEEIQLGKADTEHSSPKADTLSSGYEDCEDSKNSSSTGFVTVMKSECYSKDGAVSSFSMNNSCVDPTMSSSSSDNCSSCLSEGDISTSSSGKNTESSSTSDSEDASPQSEGRDDDSLNKCWINGGSSFTRTSAESEVADYVTNFPRDEPRTSAPVSDNGVFRFNTPPPQQQHSLPMHNQNNHMPVFSSPSTGYHNQSAFSWQASPNGLMPFPQPNHFVYPANPLGYSLPAPHSSEFGMQYNPLQSITTPLFTARHHSLYQNSNRFYVTNPKEQFRNLTAEEPVSTERQFRDRRMPSKLPPNGQNGIKGNASRPRGSSSSFSLFHFGGPTVGATEESTGRTALKSVSSHADISCSKVDTEIEEYSLFSTGNGARFSIF
ncbi:uncharacterized protein A4U43_C07F36200 [Asparagus officinalis]|uniref:Uncharacterized protein n=1 Tax=Asparagus officinalis TaxID=4686 RepID=A0A5P1EKM5_ASPOF|nr:uncharacterized protein LOC109850698 [Asparagus officinalis]ONK65349.1 uncharacterized protein A4U43_C07F36200 [Asparagus officinalis]